MNISNARSIYMATFRERFLFLKAEKKVTNEQIAKAIKTNRTSIGKLINGDLQLKNDTLRLLSEYFDVDIAYLIGESNIRRQKQQLPEDLLEVCREAANKKISAKKLRAVIKAIIQDNE